MLTTIFTVLGTQAVLILLVAIFLRLHSIRQQKDEDSIVVRYENEHAEITFMGEVTSELTYGELAQFLKSLEMATIRAKTYGANIGLRAYATEVCSFVWMGQDGPSPDEDTGLWEHTYILSLEDAGVFLTETRSSLEQALNKLKRSRKERRESKEQKKINGDSDLDKWWLSF